MAGLPQNIGVKQCFGLTLSYWSVEYLNVTAGQTNRTKIVLTTTLTPEHNNTSQTAINGNRAASRLYNCINAGSYMQSFTVSSASYDLRALYVWSCRAVCVSTVCAVNLCELLTCLLLKITLITCGLNTSLFSGPRCNMSCSGAKWKLDWLCLREELEGRKSGGPPPHLRPSGLPRLSLAELRRAVKTTGVKSGRNLLGINFRESCQSASL